MNMLPHFLIEEIDNLSASISDCVDIGCNKGIGEQINWCKPGTAMYGKIRDIRTKELIDLNDHSADYHYWRLEQEQGNTAKITKISDKTNSCDQTVMYIYPSLVIVKKCTNMYQLGYDLAACLGSCNDETFKINFDRRKVVQEETLRNKNFFLQEGLAIMKIKFSLCVLLCKENISNKDCENEQPSKFTCPTL